MPTVTCPPILFRDDLECASVAGHVHDRTERRRAVKDLIDECGYDEVEFLGQVDIARNHYSFVWMHRRPDSECPPEHDELWWHCAETDDGAMPYTEFDLTR